jgi:hypothetical protein
MQEAQQYLEDLSKVCTKEELEAIKADIVSQEADLQTKIDAKEVVIEDIK